MIPLIIILCVVLIIILLIWGSHNSLVRLNERVKEAWADITVQLKYRADLIPNVVSTVKAYAKHESEAFEHLAAARSAAMSASNVKTASKAEDQMTHALSKVMAIAESYPELKANTNFQQLQTQLQDVEDKIQAARRFYNTGAKEFNTKVKLFPTNLINSVFLHFKDYDYFEVSEEEQAKIEKAPEVKFD